MRATLFAAAICIGSFVFVARAQESDVYQESRAGDPVALANVYADQLAANDGAVEAWRATNAYGYASELSSDEQLLTSNHGCPEGTQLWRRDVDADFCALVCLSDADCGPEDGRCRVLDVADPSREPPMLLVDDMPVEEVDAWMDGTDPAMPPTMLCDPFWDLVGDAADAVGVDAASD